MTKEKKTVSKVVKRNKYYLLSYDVAVFQWITSCHKNRMTTRVLTLLREYVTSLVTSVITMLIFIGNMSTFKAIKSYLRSHMIKRILHSWSFHMKARLIKFIWNDNSCKILYVCLEIMVQWWLPKKQTL